MPAGPTKADHPLATVWWGVAIGLVAIGLVASPALGAKKELGFNVHQSNTVGPDVVVGAGTKWMRIDVNWLDVEKTQGSFDWSVIVLLASS